jgi:hypothetical protein
MSLWIWDSVSLLPLSPSYDLTYISLGCAFIYVRSAAPNKRSLGATNGLAQTSISVVRAIGPAASTSLFSLSLEKNILGGWFVYVVLVVLSAGALFASAWLPTKLWEVEEDD